MLDEVKIAENRHLMRGCHNGGKKKICSHNIAPEYRLRYAAVSAITKCIYIE